MSKLLILPFEFLVGVKVNLPFFYEREIMVNFLNQTKLIQQTKILMLYEGGSTSSPAVNYVHKPICIVKKQYTLGLKYAVLPCVRPLLLMLHSFPLMLFAVSLCVSNSKLSYSCSGVLMLGCAQGPLF